MLKIVTLGRFDLSIETPDAGVRRVRSQISRDLLTYLLCCHDLRAYNRDVKAALWPDPQFRAEQRESNFTAARKRLADWLKMVGADDALSYDALEIRLDLEHCSVDLIEAETALRKMIRGELRGRDALAALTRFEGQFLSGAIESQSSWYRLYPKILERRLKIAKLTLSATAVALRNFVVQERDTTDATFTELLRRARESHKLAVAEHGENSAEVKALAEAVLMADELSVHSNKAIHRRPRSQLIGRDQELRDLIRLVNGAQKGLLVFVEGPAGVGTTALVRAAADELAANEQRLIFDLPSQDRERGPADAPGAATLAAVELIGPALAAPALQPLAAGLVQAIPQLAPWFDHLRDNRAASIGNPAALLANAVRLLDRVRPALVIVDRLDLTDPCTRAFTIELVSQIERYDVRLAVLLTARPSDYRRRSFPLHIDNLKRLSIEPLNDRATHKLAMSAVANNIDVEALVALADGLPANVAYLAKRDGKVDGDFAAERLKDASSSARQLITAFALSGPTDLRTAVVSAGGTPGDDRWFDALEELLDEGWLDSREASYVVRETLMARSLKASCAPN